MACHKAQAIFAAKRCTFRNKLGKIASARIGINVLTEQGYILIAAFNKRSHLGNNVCLIARALSAARIGHNAIAAKVVTAIHNRHPSLIATFAANGHTLAYYSEFVVRLFGYEAEAFFRFKRRFYYFRDSVVHIRSENKINIRVAFIYLLAAVRLLSHTSAKPDLNRTVLFFSALELTRLGKRSYLGVLANGAGVNYYKVGRIAFFCYFIAAKCQCARNAFAVVFVLLAAKGYNASLFARNKRAERLCYCLLALDLLVFNKYVHQNAVPTQIKFSFKSSFSSYFSITTLPLEAEA